MPRTLDPVAHASRRDEFIDVAQRLLASRGYEQLSVQEILVEVGSSKGAFYHYFDSKQALLEAVIERMTDAVLEAVAPMAADPNLPAIEKLRGLFGLIADWKAVRKDLVLGLLDVWFSDENTIVREKFRTGTVTRLTPLLAAIVRQGAAEGVFTADSPEHTANVLISLIQGLNETASRLYLARQANTISFEDVQRTLAAYADALQRILGSTDTSLGMLDEPTLRLWFD